MKHVLFFWFILMVILLSCNTHSIDTRVRTGLDNIHQYEQLFRGKRVGIITNHTALNFHGEHVIDVFDKMENVTITALFGPEHGIRGHAEAGAKVHSAYDPTKGIPIYSLYGKTRKPTPEMLKNVDVLVFDIQDIGARFYTYIYTMALAMEAAAEQGIPFVVLDRPNPINGIAVEGNILDPRFRSFVGLYPLPVRHGMTVGELAKMINGEGWLAKGIQADLTVVPLKNWRREMWFDQTGLKFIKTSPNMPDLETATVYPGICLLEGTNVSAGRGTTMPFKIFGAPWINGQQLAQALNALQLPGVRFRDTTFTPVPILGAANHPKFEHQQCGGVRIIVTDRNQFQPYLTGIHVVNTIYHLYSDQFQWKSSHFDRLTGTDQIRKAIIAGTAIQKLVSSWQPELQQFLSRRRGYLLY